MCKPTLTMWQLFKDQRSAMVCFKKRLISFDRYQRNSVKIKLQPKSSIPINLAFEWRVLLQKPSGGPSRLSQVRKGKEAVSDEFCEPTVTLMVSHPRQEATLVIHALSLSLSLSSSYLLHSVRLSTVFVHWRLFLVLFWDRPQRFSAKTTQADPPWSRVRSRFI